MRESAKEAQLKRTRDQADTDPLPYTQVDRAVKQTAAVIASKLGVSFQHALGGLVQFWELNGDPRDLEALLRSGQREVALSREEIARRFALAMATDTTRIDPDDLTSLRLLERKPDGSYRVRGMSRYLKPMEARLQFRDASIAGGKARAAGARGADGRFLPRSRRPVAGGRSAGEPAGASAGVPAGRPAGEPAGVVPAEVTRFQLEPTSRRSTTAGSGRAVERSPASNNPAPSSRSRALSDRLASCFQIARGAPYAFGGGKDGKALQRLLAMGTDDEITARWERGLELGSKWPGVSTFAQLADRWNDLTAPLSDPRRAPMEARRGSGPITSKELFPT